MNNGLRIVLILIAVVGALALGRLLYALLKARAKRMREGARHEGWGRDQWANWDNWDKELEEGRRAASVHTEQTLQGLETSETSLQAQQLA